VEINFLKFGRKLSLTLLILGLVLEATAVILALNAATVDILDSMGSNF